MGPTSRQRTRSGRLLFGGAALGATGFFAGLAVAPLAAEELTGGVTWSGLPGAVGIIGTALGAVGVAAAAMAVAAIGYQFVLRPDPGALAVEEIVGEDEDDEGALGPAHPVWRLPVVQIAIVVMITGQVVMVWLMSMTPVHIREAGGDLNRIGLTLSANIVGMYALAPLAGWVEDRFGSLRAIAVALGTLAASAVLAAVAPVGGLLMGLALFLLGLGWSFGFTAGSTMLSRGTPAAVRAAVQGRVETIVWSTSAAGSLGAGLLLDAVGFVGLCVLALVALVVPTAFVMRRRQGLPVRDVPVSVANRKG